MPTFSKGQKVMVDKEAGFQPGYWQRHLYWGKIVDESNGLYTVRAEAVGFASVSRKAREDVEGPGSGPFVPVEWAPVHEDVTDVTGVSGDMMRAQEEKPAAATWIKIRWDDDPARAVYVHGGS